MTTNQDFRVVQEAAQTEGCINLGQAQEKSDRVLVNEKGHILLDPIDNLADREKWLW